MYLSAKYVVLRMARSCDNQVPVENSLGCSSRTQKQTHAAKKLKYVQTYANNIIVLFSE